MKYFLEQVANAHVPKVLIYNQFEVSRQGLTGSFGRYQASGKKRLLGGIDDPDCPGRFFVQAS